MSHYDSKLKNIFINDNSERSFISSSIESSNFKDDIIKASLIKKEKIDSCPIMDIIQKSSNYDEEELKKETNEKNINKIPKLIETSYENIINSKNSSNFNENSKDFFFKKRQRRRK